MLLETSHLLKRDSCTKNSKLKQKFKHYLSYCFGFVVTVALSLLCIDVVYAADTQYNIEAGITAGTKPAIEAVRAHWGKGVLLSSCGAAIWGEGDARQRAVRAAVGAGAAGMAVLGLLAMLGGAA